VDLGRVWKKNIWRGDQKAKQIRWGLLKYFQDFFLAYNVERVINVTRFQVRSKKIQTQIYEKAGTHTRKQIFYGSV